MSFMMTSITKAHGVDVPDCTISISDASSVPEFQGDGDWPAKMRAFYDDQGERLANALTRSLPGGTLDSLMCALLKQKASLLRVPLV